MVIAFITSQIVTMSLIAQNQKLIAFLLSTNSLDPAETSSCHYFGGGTRQWLAFPANIISKYSA